MQIINKKHSSECDTFIAMITTPVAMMAYECHGVSNLQQLFTQQLIQAIVKENNQSPHYLPYVRGIDQSLVDSPHKWPVIPKALPRHHTIVKQQWMQTDALL